MSFGLPVVMGLDIGTSSVRGALFDARGDEVGGTEARFVRGFKTTLEGGAEVDAEAAVEEVASVIDEVLERSAGLAHGIELVAVSCFWHSLVGLDNEGRALTPLMGWADTRAAHAAEELRQQLDERRVHARTGCRLHHTYWPARLRWLQRERPQVYARVRRWLSFSDFLSSRFFGEMKTSISMASGTGLLNLSRCDWDEELTSSLGIERDRLPAIADERETCGELRGAYARRWPQLKRARWAHAIADGAANNIGAGCITRERAALMIGTSGAMRVMSEGMPPAQLTPELWCYRADRRRVLLGGALSDGGNLYEWMRAALALDDDEGGALELALARLEPDAHGLTILPFWSGERSTGWSTRARGAILGLMTGTRPLDILRASMEAVAYRLALIKEALESFAPQVSIVATGGALLASRLWAQIIADAMGCAIELSTVREASTRGAVLLALEGAGKIKSIADARVRAGRTIEPNAGHHAIYRRAIERQQEIYQRLVAD